ncbi:hypothetical protein D3C81_1969520 [compost metagenome]
MGGHRRTDVFQTFSDDHAGVEGRRHGQGLRSVPQQNDLTFSGRSAVESDIRPLDHAPALSPCCGLQTNTPGGAS